MKPYILLVWQKIIYFFWKYFCFKKVDVYYGYEIKRKKISCPLVYYKKDGKSIAVEFYFMFGGFFIGYDKNGNSVSKK